MKPRNKFVLLAIRRRAGAHGKSRKAQRRSDKVNIKSMEAS